MDETTVKSGVCPECGDPPGRPRSQPWYVRVFGLRPRPAECRELGEVDPSGWPTECGCTHPFHGS